MNTKLKILTGLLLPLISVVYQIHQTLQQNDPQYSSPFSEQFNMTHIETLSTDKTIVITGANAGLGFSTAKLLVLGGTAKMVIMGCRSIDKCNAARASIIKQQKELRLAAYNHGILWPKYETRVVALHLDLASLDSVRKFASEVQTTLSGGENGARAQPSLDILINNAGIMGVPHEIITETNTEIQMHVNHLAHFALTSHLMKNLQAGGKGRIVSVSSIAAAEWFQKWCSPIDSVRQYGESKRANLLFSHGVHRRFHDKGISAVSAHPGYSRTSITVSGWSFAPMFLRQFMGMNPFGSMSSDDGAMPQIRAALDEENVKSDDYVGPLFLAVGKPVIVGSSLQSLHHAFWPIKEEASNELWRWSEERLGITFG